MVFVSVRMACVSGNAIVSENVFFRKTECSTLFCYVFLLHVQTLENSTRVLFLNKISRRHWREQTNLVISKTPFPAFA